MKETFRRHDDDAYMTPAWAISAILPHLPLARVNTVLEPCCGTGNIVAELVTLAAQTPVFKPSLIEVGDINPDYVQQTLNRCAQPRGLVMAARSNSDDGSLIQQVRDYRENHSLYDLTITNPPFSSAQEIACHCLKYHALGGGCVALLLRLAFLEGVNRAAFHREFPSDVYVLRRRPKFREDVKSADRWAYAWFVWGSGAGGHWTVL